MGVLVAGNKPAPVSPAAHAPDFRLMDLDRNPVSLSAYQDKTVVLVFHSLRCPTSNAYRFRLTRLADELAGSAQIILINSYVRHEDAPAVGEIRSQSRAARHTFPTLLDPTGETAKAYEVQVTPTVVLVDRGLIRYQGAFDDNQNEAMVHQRYCEDAVRAVLDQRPPAVAFTQAFGCPIRPK
jgi:peroxiredoxin